jgi:hypothetical protein
MNQLMRTINYKDHLNKVLEWRLKRYKRKLIKENKERRRIVKQIIQETKCNREEMIKEQEELEEIM